ncbi:MAG: NAD(+) synthase [Oscillospiraceae bacterium]|nr:NAD(+) synthase [Oscillospiraceae bacterium]
MKDGFIKVAAATTEVRAAHCEFNAKGIISAAKSAASDGAKLIVFPELCITGYTCGDLFLQQTLLKGAENALAEIKEKTASLDALIAVGLPVRSGSALYNCAAVLCKGTLLGLVPKMNIPSYSEFYEGRHFTSGKSVRSGTTVNICGEYVPMITDGIFRCEEMPDFSVGIEICEDLWVVEPPSDRLALAGAAVICNLSASDEVIGKGSYRRQLVSAQSAKLIAGYIYSSAGFGESTQDMVFSGHDIIAENGTVLAETKKFASDIIMTEIDVSKLMSERRRMTTYGGDVQPCTEIYFSLKPELTELTRMFPRTPFVPSGKQDLAQRCEEILTMQAVGLATRLKHISCETAVIGLSGGLDSTLALIVTVHAFDMLGLDRLGILTVTMPCFGTTSRTKNNALTLAQAYGVSLTEINIADSVRSHFKDIEHDESVHDVTYENCQARERTQVLMDIANQAGGIVIGTGDLSELALGWATYNGDHMSMYGVNSSIPKTLVRHLVSYEADHSGAKLGNVLRDILDTPVSPELLPPSQNGEISQKTEDIVGPYELHDFFLYYMVRFGFMPSKIFRLAQLAFIGKYDSTEIKKWLKIFVRRFFAQQFKRSCLPDGPKVGSVTLSPRGDFRMPSDASADLWLKDAESL